MKSTKAKWQWDWQRLADEQAEKDRCMAAKEKAEKEQQEQLAELAELAQVNWDVSPDIFQILAF